MKTKLDNQLTLNNTINYNSPNPYAELKQLKNQFKKTGPIRGQSANKNNTKTFYGTTSAESKKL